MTKGTTYATTIFLRGVHSKFQPGDAITRGDIDADLFDSLCERGKILATGGLVTAQQPSLVGEKPPETTLPRKRK